MKMSKFIGCFLITAGLFGVSTIVSADGKDLWINNIAKENFTLEINGACSSEFGVIKGRSTYKIAHADFKKVCGKDCVSLVFASDHCSGKYIASIGFNTKTGVTYLSGPTDMSYLIDTEGDAFHITINDYNNFHHVARPALINN